MCHDHLSSTSASHPVGTTTRVQDFLTKIPVRRQTALKATTKTLEAIRHLLFSFAFARPEVRYSLKVLKGKNDKMNWTYAPTPSRALIQAATKVVGNDIASACAAHAINTEDYDTLAGTEWSIDAVLISTTAGRLKASTVPSRANRSDPSKIRNATQYISVDGRPVSTERATMKEIVKSYKRRVQTRLLSSTHASISRPFLVMQIQCPPESYDVNVEPAKDEVLFLGRRNEQLLSLIECLFDRAYPIIDKQEESEVISGHASPKDVSVLDSDSAVDGKDVEQDANEQEAEVSEDSRSRKTSLRNPFVIAAMNAKVKPQRMDTNLQSTSSKMTTSPNCEHNNVGVLGEVRQHTVNAFEASSDQVQQPTLPRTASVSPPTSPKPGPPKRRWRAANRTNPDGGERLSQVSYTNDHIATPQRRGLHAWLTPDSGHPFEIRATSDNNQDPVLPPEPTTAASLTLSPRYSNVSPSSQKGRWWGAGLKPFKIPSKTRSQRHISENLIPTPPSSLHVQHEHQLQRDLQGLPAGFQHDEDDTMSLGAGQRLLQRGTRGPSANLSSSEQLESGSELNDIMDFEHRKKAATAHQRRVTARFPSTSVKEMTSEPSQYNSHGARVSDPMETRPREDSVIEDFDARFCSDEETSSKKTTSNPHQNRYFKALKDLSSAHPDAESGNMFNGSGESVPPDLRTTAASEAPELSPNDARFYLMRQQRQPSHGRLRRTKSAKLPLGSIFPGSETFDLAFTTATYEKLQSFKEHVQRLRADDTYLTHGILEFTDFNSTDVPTIDDWKRTLRNMIEFRYPAQNQEEREVIRNLRIAIPNTS